jgi:glycosyltransferase involved in cell wall biosynthesis
MTHYALVPAFNEEKNIEEVILRLRKHKNVNVIVVDDGSTDATPQIVKKMGTVLVRHETNKGKGEAINSGFNFILKNYPKTKYVVVIDADMQYLPEEAMKLLKPLEDGKADFVTGYRDWSEVPFRHRLGNFVWRKFFNILFGTDFKDTNCGYIALTRNAMKKVKRALHGGYIIENSVFIEAIKNNFRIKQVPVTVVYKRKSGVVRGIRIVFGVFIFILIEGLKFRLGIKD